MRLKIVSNEKNAILSVDDNASLSQFLEKLQLEELISSGDDYSIRFGFPPKQVELTNKSCPLLELGIRAGDKLVISSLKTPEQGPQATPTVRQQKPAPETPHIRLSTGYVSLVKIPEDNSCLFRSITTAVFQGLSDPSELRSVVADTIRENKDDLYDSAFLGRPVEEYLKWIIQPTSWGGAIEIDILSKFLGVCINSIDVETGRIDSFNSKAQNYIIVFYTGIHYDTVEYTDDETEEKITNFVIGSELGQEVLENIQQLVKQLNHKGYVTNTSKFSIKCNVCNTVLKGEREASQHASETMHYEFGEI